MVGYDLVGTRGSLYLKGRYPDIISSTNITGSAIDSVHGIIYAQFPDANQPAGPSTSIPASATPALPAAMLIMDSDNLTFRDRISIPEDMVGRAVLNAAGTVLYAVSESGVMVLPVGSLNSSHRVAATQEDLLVTTNFCNSRRIGPKPDDHGSGRRPNRLRFDHHSGRVSRLCPHRELRPPPFRCWLTPTAIAFTGGTAAITLTLTSSSAVNQPKPVRLLVNNPNPNQRGTIVDQPGVLSDILPDQARNRRLCPASGYEPASGVRWKFAVGDHDASYRHVTDDDGDDERSELYDGRP